MTRQEILAAIASGKNTTVAIAAHFGADRNVIAARLRYMAKCGLISCVGKRPSKGGNPINVWAVGKNDKLPSAPAERWAALVNFVNPFKVQECHR